MLSEKTVSVPLPNDAKLQHILFFCAIHYLVSTINIVLFQDPGVLLLTSHQPWLCGTVTEFVLTCVENQRVYGGGQNIQDKSLRIYRKLWGLKNDLLWRSWLCCRVHQHPAKFFFGICIYVLHRWTVASFGCILLQHLNCVASSCLNICTMPKTFCCSASINRQHLGYCVIYSFTPNYSLCPQYC